MTAPAPSGAPQSDPTSPREEDADFAAACARQDYGLLQDALRGMSKRDAVAHILGLFGHLSEWWVRRHFARLMSLSPDELRRVIAYADPTGEHATNLAMGRAA